MEISGKIITVMPSTGGISNSSGKEWKKQEYVLETSEQYPKKVCFHLFGSDRIEQAAIKLGEELTVSFDIESREFNGKWYTNINAWKVERKSGNVASEAQSMPSYQTSSAVYSDEKTDIPNFPLPEASDDLPF